MHFSGLSLLFPFGDNASIFFAGAKRIATVGLAAWCCATSAQVDPTDLSFQSLGTGWHLATFPQQRMPQTSYSDALEAGRLALRLEARESYSPLVKTFNPPIALTRVSWTWRVAQQSAAIDLRTKAGDDTAAKVCISLVWPDPWVPFLERQLLRIARSRTDQSLPGATVCWAWAAAETTNTVIENPYTRRVRSIVLRTSAQVGADWFTEKREVQIDLRRTFGDEWPVSAPTPLVTAILVAADADNTASHSIAWVSGLKYE